MIEIFDCEQGTPEWLACRLGIPTSSEFKSVLAKGEGKTRRTYMMKLLGERFTGEPAEGFTNGHMERGRIMEAEARKLYSFVHDVEPQQVGFVRNGPKGCSPDSLIGDVGMLEIKTKAPKTLIEAILADEFCAEHKAQCQGALWVAEREWIDLAVYWPGLPLFVKRAHRDEAYIATLAEAVEAFNTELAGVVEKVRGYGTTTQALAA